VVGREVYKLLDDRKKTACVDARYFLKLAPYAFTSDQDFTRGTLLICILDQFEASHPSFPLLLVLDLVLISTPSRVCPL
jgi:hypothetical protein